MDKENKSEGNKVVIQTYKSDMENALGATEVGEVQDLLKVARDRENFEKEVIVGRRQRAFYVLATLVIMSISILSVLFAFYNYKKLTVAVEKEFSVGIFQKTSPISVSDTTVTNLFTKIENIELYPDNKPIVLNLVPENKNEFFKFIGAKVTEPFAYQIQVIRAGFINQGESTTPFIIMYVNESEVASKEFLIFESEILNSFYKILNINIDNYKERVGSSFVSDYFYNLPVRVLRDGDDIVLFYGYATPNTIVMTSKPYVFKAVYDTIIKQI